MSKEELSSHAKTGWTKYLEAENQVPDVQEGLFANCVTAPTELAQALSSSLEGLFFLFLPKELWIDIAVESSGTKSSIELFVQIK
ncbi:hypothetical protein F444_23015 [Phytophthora nicotianae P1976]|uniref:Uncharacterized protein n=1 Tax=Phytophthora nicotianae P1976 TaxID=1317066 RepID=A0A080YW46_PHYNI|nr:hypothetical protein F444_23015 [Phytophthora nicotianae P1976]